MLILSCSLHILTNNLTSLFNSRHLEHRKSFLYQTKNNSSNFCVNQKDLVHVVKMYFKLWFDIEFKMQGTLQFEFHENVFLSDNV